LKILNTYFIEGRLEIPMSDYIKENHNIVNRIRERGFYDEETVHNIIDSTLICHVSFIQDGRPFVIPTIHARSGRTIYLHGAKASRLLGETGKGNELCLCFTHVDGIVLARSLYNSSMNYRSVVAFGKGRVATIEEKLEAMKIMTEGLVPGRWEGARQPNDKEMKSTSIVAIDIDHASAKIREGEAGDFEEDIPGPWWAGVLPIESKILPPISNSDLSSGIETPDNVKKIIGKIF
jgi:nitroimidazol reductase NimA-like FMN-containing flavoprotein (pyridoxamine 5'-phosphate oxidase superfamily)